MKTAAEITTEEFDQAVRDLAESDGVGVVLSIPGVWEHVSEYYNNDAIDRCCDDDDDDDDVPCDRCGGDGVVHLHDHPDLWADDACTEENELVPCPDCAVPIIVPPSGGPSKIIMSRPGAQTLHSAVYGTDDDLRIIDDLFWCVDCVYCDYRGAEESRCSKGWPYVLSDDNPADFASCDDYERKSKPRAVCPRCFNVVDRLFVRLGSPHRLCLGCFAAKPIYTNHIQGRPQLDDSGNVIHRPATCGTCGRTWNDAIISDTTPVPSGRCPFEHEHEHGDDA